MGSVFIGVACADQPPLRSVHSIYQIAHEKGDNLVFVTGTTGDQARNGLVEEFLPHSKYEALLLLDGDMLFPADTLKRLRAHNLPIVSGYYTRRTLPTFPVAYAPGKIWPLTPLMEAPETGLVEIGASGFGCLYVKREVFKAMDTVLRYKEWYICSGPYPEATGHYGRVGADLIFFDRARRLGFPSYVDMDVKCDHSILGMIGYEQWLGQETDRPWVDAYRELADDKAANQIHKGESPVHPEILDSRATWHEKSIQRVEIEKQKLRVQMRELKRQESLHRGALEESEEWNRSTSQS